MKELIAQLLQSALLDLLNDQPDILYRNELTTMTEWNFCHHFARYLNQYFPWFDCDCDLSKHFNNKTYKRPDIILHHRGNYNKKNISFNFLVVETKLDFGKSNEDIERINHDWFEDCYKYRFGAILNIQKSIQGAFHYLIQIYQRDCPTTEDPIVITESTTRKVSYCKENFNFVRKPNKELWDSLDLDKLKTEILNNIKIL